MSVDIDSGSAVPLTQARRSPLQRLTSLFVQLFERYTPDPYILAVGLTILTGLLAAVLAPKGSLPTILSGWYTGLVQHSGFRVPGAADSRSGVCAFDLSAGSIALELACVVRFHAAACDRCDNCYGVHRLVPELGIRSDRSRFAHARDRQANPD